MATNQPFLLGYNTQCIAYPNKGFQFSSWTQSLGHNSTKSTSTSTISYDNPLNSFLNLVGQTPNDTAAVLNTSEFGNFTANFKEVSPPIPAEYWIPLYGVIVSTIVGWSIPNIIGWTKTWTTVRK